MKQKSVLSHVISVEQANRCGKRKRHDKTPLLILSRVSIN